MTHLDNLVADSLAQSSDTVVHQLASEVVRLRSKIADLRTIPADRVLGEGMVAVDAEELRALERVRMEAEYVKDAFQQMGEFSQMESIMRALHELDAIRANQGGTEHG